MTKNICNQTWTRGLTRECHVSMPHGSHRNTTRSSQSARNMAATLARHVQPCHHATWRPRHHAPWRPRQHATWRPCQLPACQTPFGSLTDCHAMMKSWAQQWRKRFVMEWNLCDDTIFVIEWVLIYDENYHFVTVVNQWHSFHDEHYFITNSSQKELHDDFGIFSDERVVSLMSTYRTHLEF